MSLATDAVRGLRGREKELSCKYFYDARGSALFEQICEQKEYYPTRSEIGLLRKHAAQIARCIGQQAEIIEFGSGSCVKTALLLEGLTRPSGYVPVDICSEALEQSCLKLRCRYPNLRIHPVAADFTCDFALPNSCGGRRKVLFFPGSTLGNFTDEEAAALLRRMCRLAGPQGGVLLGIDREKDGRKLDAAYNDAAGVTAAFNLNLLIRLNRETGAGFRLEDFRHRAFYTRAAGRVEMHLESRAEQAVSINGTIIDFKKGDSIRTEYSHKYSALKIEELASAAGLGIKNVWTDADNCFSILFLTPAP